MIGMTVTSKEKGTLRKMIDVSGSKLIRFSDFEAFMKKETGTDISLTPEKSQIASLPVNMPSLPENYSHRHDVEDRIRDLLVLGKTCKGNTVAAQGMGGVGKSCIKSAVIQTSAVRETFLDGIAWLSLVSLVC
jgi:CO dehydrogenase nickel-insertion accessory protein CooC1